MAHTVTFNPDGGPLRVRFTFTGLMVAAYAFTLWSAEDNSRVMYEEGNNQNPADDEYDLPQPPRRNKGRLIQLRTEFVGLDPDASPGYEIGVEVIQGDDVIGGFSDTGDITGKAQSSLLFVTLATA